MNEPELGPQEGGGQQADLPLTDERNNRDIERTCSVSNHEKPYSAFGEWKKRGIAAGAACTAIFSPITAQIYLPALTQISKDLQVTASHINLTITTYMIFQGITPMFIGSLADSGGRRPAYIVCFIVYMAANIGLALAPNYGALLGLRCLQSAGSSSTMALCTAVVADIVTSAERGQYIGFTAMPTVLAPSLGPIIGGLLSQFLGWRAVFWFLAITSGVALLLIITFFPETCRRVVDDGSVAPPPLNRSLWQMVHIARQRSLRRRNDVQKVATEVGYASRKNYFNFKAPNVLESLFLLFQKANGVLLWTSSLVFAGFYCITTSMPTLFAKSYGFNEIQTGLMYLPQAVGTLGSAMLVGPLINKNFKRHCIRCGIPYDRSRQQDLSEIPIERARHEVGLPLLCVAGASLIGWGWAMHAVTHVAVPCAMSFGLGVGMSGFNNITNILLIDLNPGKAGTATAANNLTRCLVGAGASAAIIPMIDAMGVGCAFTLVGALYFISFIPLLALLKYGMKWRAERGSNEGKKSGQTSGALQP